MPIATNRTMRSLALVACFIGITTPSTSALTYDVHLYRPIDIAKRGISAAVEETESGSLRCTFTFSKEKLDITGIELVARTEHAAINMELATHEKDGSLVCRFTLSRELLMHGQLTVGLNDRIPGGTFLHVAFVDLIDFGDNLSPLLKRRQERMIEMGLIEPNDLEKKIEKLTNAPPARGEDKDADKDRDQLEKLDLRQSKIPVKPYKAPAERGEQKVPERTER